MRLGVFWRFAIRGRSRGVALVSASPLSCAYPAVCDTSFYFSCAQGGGEVQGGPRTRRGATSPFHSAGRNGFLFVRRPLGLTSMCRVVPHNPSNSAHRIDWRRLMLALFTCEARQPETAAGALLTSTIHEYRRILLRTPSSISTTRHPRGSYLPTTIVSSVETPQPFRSRFSNTPSSALPRTPPSWQTGRHHLPTSGRPTPEQSLGNSRGGQEPQNIAGQASCLRGTA